MIFTDYAYKPEPMAFDEAFDFFKDAVRFWAEALGLHDYEVVVGTADMPDRLASVSVRNEARIAVINLSSNSSVTSDCLDFSSTVLFNVALHEVLEVLLYESMLIMNDTDRGMESKRDAMEAHRHSIIHRLTPLLCSSSEADTFLSDYEFLSEHEGAGV